MRLLRLLLLMMMVLMMLLGLRLHLHLERRLSAGVGRIAEVHHPHWAQLHPGRGHATVACVAVALSARTAARGTARLHGQGKLVLKRTLVVEWIIKPSSGASGICSTASRVRMLLVLLVLLLMVAHSSGCRGAIGSGELAHRGGRKSPSRLAIGRQERHVALSSLRRGAGPKRHESGLLLVLQRLLLLMLVDCHLEIHSGWTHHRRVVLVQ